MGWRWLAVVLLAGCGRWAFDGVNPDATGDGAGSDDGAPDAMPSLARISLVAGNLNPAGHADGTGTAAVFSLPEDLASDGTYLYVADSGNSTIRRVTLATGDVTTVAGTPWTRGTVDGIGPAARFSVPTGLALVGTSLYVADPAQHVIRKLDTNTGEVTTLAGLAGITGSTNGVGAAARFNGPRSIASDGTTLWVLEEGAHRVRAIELASGQVTFLAGGTLGSANGQGAAAQFWYPRGLAYEGGQLFVADYWNNTVRVINPTTGDVTTAFAAVTDGRFSGISVTPSAVFLTNGNRLLRYDRPAYTQTIIGGERWTEGSRDGVGNQSRFKAPEGLLVVGTSLYVADTRNSNLRRLDIATNTTAIAAGRLGLTTGSLDGIGPAARYEALNDLVTDGTSIYVADESAYVLRQIDIATGMSTTVAGTAGMYGTTDAVGSAARMHRPSGLTLHGGLVYFVDEDSHRLRSFDPTTRMVTTHAGGSGGSLDATGLAAQFSFPTDVASDGTYLYVADRSNHTIRRVDPTTWEVITIAGTPGTSGYGDNTGAAARFDAPRSVEVCGGALFVTEDDNATIRRIDLTTYEVSTIAGVYNDRRYVDGPGGLARFDEAYGLACDGARLVVADSGNHVLRAIDLATHEVSTIAGAYRTAYDLDGPLSTARLNAPFGVATAGGKIYVANTYNVRVIE